MNQIVRNVGIGRFILYLLATCMGCSLLVYSIDVVSNLNDPPPTWTPRDIIASISPTIPTPALTPWNTSISTATPLPTDTPIPTHTNTSAPLAPHAECIPTNSIITYATVTGITDGDTITVQFEDGTSARVRYIGVDAPESGDSISAAATNRNTELTAWKTAMLVKDVSEADRYDRLLRYVIVDGVFINYELVRQGYATAKSYPPDTACDSTFREVQATAQAALLGVWEPLPTIVSRSSSIDTGTAVCSCSGNIYNCSDFASHAQAQACFDYCMSVGAGDVHWLDGDDDGSACESLP